MQKADVSLDHRRRRDLIAGFGRPMSSQALKCVSFQGRPQRLVPMPPL